MCEFVRRGREEGVLFSDGQFVPIEDINIEELSEDQRRELEDMKLLNELSMRKTMHRLGNSLQRLENKTEKVIERLDSMTIHGGTPIELCPVNPKAIRGIVQEEVMTNKKIAEHLDVYWVKTLQGKLIKIGKMAKSILAILGLMGLVATLINYLR